jgi:hypothetical protein
MFPDVNEIERIRKKYNWHINIWLASPLVMFLHIPLHILLGKRMLR